MLLTIFFFQDILSSQKVASRVRAFDLILNLGVHAHLLEPILHEDSLIIEEEDPQESSLNSLEQPIGKASPESESPLQLKLSPAIDKFETWLLAILFEILQFLVQVINFSECYSC